MKNSELLKLKHVCEWYYMPGSLTGVKPAGATFRKFEFKLCCMACRLQRGIKSTTESIAKAEIAKYPVMPQFPK